MKGIKNIFRKPQNWLPQLAMGLAAPFTGGASLLGLGATAAYGGYRGYREAKRAGTSGLGGIFKGAVGGAGLGMLGAGLGSAAQTFMRGGLSEAALMGPGYGFQGAVPGAMGAGITPGAGAALGLGGMLATGFGEGVAGAVPEQFQGLLPGGAGAGAGRGVFDLSNPMTSLGLATLAGTDLLTSPTPPQIGPTVSKWLTADTVTRAGQVAKGIAEEEYLGEFNVDKETQAFMDVMQKDIEKQYKRRHADMDKMGLAQSEQWMSSGERLEMHRRLDEEMARETNNMRSEWLLNARRTYAKQRYDYVMGQLDIDESVKRDLLYADIADITWKYNLEREDIMKFRELAQEAGLYMLRQGMGE